jgi:TrmH family RNA methyltransferase
MISKNQLKVLCSYKQQKQCDAEGVYVVEGMKMCAEALAWKQPILCVAALPQWLEPHRSLLSAVVTLKEDRIYELADADLERLSGQHTPNQVWMLLGKPAAETEWKADKGEGLLLALDHLQDPGNLGTIIRTADWFGIRHIVCSPDTVSCFNPKVVQSTMGSLFRTHLLYTELAPALKDLHQQGHPLLGAMLDGEDLYKMKMPEHANDAPQSTNKMQSEKNDNTLPVLIIGNESKGLSDEIASLVTHRVCIPNRGGTCESLNASIATAILISELMNKNIVGY